jgi:hypothetical protein
MSSIKNALFRLAKLFPRRLQIRIKEVQLSRMTAQRLASGHPYDFPVASPLTGFDRPFLGTADAGFFSRLYQAPHYVLRTMVARYPELFMVEVVNGSRHDGTVTMDVEGDVVFPLAIDEPTARLEVETPSGLTAVREMPRDRFKYLTVHGGGPVRFTSSSSFVVGRPIAMTCTQRNPCKLVLCLFVDGLSDLTVLGPDILEAAMPRTFEFFAAGSIFTDHHATSEWSLPGVATLWSGLHTHRHGLFHPEARHVLGTDYPTLGDTFHAAGYLTFQAGGNWRSSPAYGYAKGFDRSIYQKQMDVTNVTHCFKEHWRAFPERDHFVWLGLFDLHHVLYAVPDISVQVRASRAMHERRSQAGVKSVFAEYDAARTDTYLRQLARLDCYLQEIYDFISTRYHEDEILVTLCSDHGQAYLTADRHVLSAARTRVPWMVRGRGVPAGRFDELTDNTDILPSLADLIGVELVPHVGHGNIPRAFGGAEGKVYVLAESLFPGQTYKVAIRDHLRECRLESEYPIDPGGKIRLGTLGIEVKARNGAGVPDDPAFANSCKDIVNHKVAEWNQSGRLVTGLRDGSRRRRLL